MAIVNSRAAIEPKTGKAAIFVNETIPSLMRKLFSNGEQGFFYDPNDLTTMFQDAAGTVPVTTVGQPVGLILDKSKGLVLGEELWTNPAPTTIIDSGETSGSYNVTTKTLRNTVASTSAARPLFRFPFNWQAGKWYLFKGKIKSGYEKLFAGSIRFGSNTGFTQVPVNQTTGEFSAIATAPDAIISIIFATGATGDIVLDHISIRELKGNHAYQNTSASRPILRDTPRRIDYDQVDDKLITSFPAPLTNATIVRAVPGVGAQILTGQSIPATYEDSIDHCGLIVINRALTPSETSAITAEFNKRAGV